MISRADSTKVSYVRACLTTQAVQVVRVAVCIVVCASAGHDRGVTLTLQPNLNPDANFSESQPQPHPHGGVQWAMTPTPTSGANCMQYISINPGLAGASAWQSSPLGWLSDLGFNNKADRIAHLVEQHERYMRRERSSPVWVRVKGAGEV